MPNGGMDNCSTCWFNRKAITPDRDLEDYCELRGFEIAISRYTYCVNHPYRIPWKLEVPIGPVYAGISRDVTIPATYNDDVRDALLDLIWKMPELCRDEYPHGASLAEVVIGELVGQRERQAIPHLERLATMDAGEPDRNGQTLAYVIELARSGLVTMRGAAPPDIDA